MLKKEYIILFKFKTLEDFLKKWGEKSNEYQYDFVQLFDQDSSIRKKFRKKRGEWKETLEEFSHSTVI